MIQRRLLQAASRFMLTILLLGLVLTVLQQSRDNGRESRRIEHLETERADAARDTKDVVLALVDDIQALREQLIKAHLVPVRGPAGATGRTGRQAPAATPTPVPSARPSARPTSRATPSRTPAPQPSRTPSASPTPTVVCAAGVCVTPCPQIVCRAEGATVMGRAKKQVVDPVITAATAAKRRAAQIAERVAWTAAEAGLAYVATVLVPKMGPEWTIVLAPSFAALKGYVATLVGNGDSAATLPQSLDPSPAAVAAGQVIVPDAGTF